MGWGILFIGLCVGSFLNVVIYRLPRGLSVNNPKRSFCPHCQTSLPAWQNLPVVTWLIQRGRCRNCQAPIAVRYLLVEVLTGVLYLGAWRFLPIISAILAIVLFTILVTVTFIDAEHQLIPTSWTTVGTVIALGGSLLVPKLLDLPGLELDWIRESGWVGLKVSAIGWVIGFGSLWAVVLLGKLIFGRLRMNFTEALPWRLQEGHEDNEQLHFVIGREAHSWDELFYRSTDQIVVQGHGFKLDGRRQPAKEVRIHRDYLKIGRETWKISDLKSLEGKATNVTIPREAMGMGDPHLLGMIGAFLGWPAAVFVIFASCLSAIIAALVARVGFGKPLPYGPFLAFGALVWIFGGAQVWIWYFEGIQHGFSP